MAADRWIIARKISTIVLCFAIGIILGNIPIIPLSEPVAEMARNLSIMLAMPLLLFSSDIRSWLKQSHDTIISYGLFVLSVILATIAAALLFSKTITQPFLASGMTGGILTGGTVNLFAVANALDIDSETVTLVNSSQIFWGAIYLLFLLTFAQRLFSHILPNKTGQSNENIENEVLDYKGMNRLDIIIGVGCSIAIIAISAALSFLIWRRLNDTFVILSITTLSLIVSLNRRISELKGPFEVGDYLLLIFGVAVGMSSNFYKLIMEGGPYIIFMASIYLVAVSIHLILSRLLSIDRDTFIITSAAGVYGPVFIVQIARALRNKNIIVGGLAASLCGVAIGTYTGLLIAYIAEWLLT